MDSDGTNPSTLEAASNEAYRKPWARLIGVHDLIFEERIGFPPVITLLRDYEQLSLDPDSSVRAHRKSFSKRRASEHFDITLFQ